MEGYDIKQEINNNIIINNKENSFDKLCKLQKLIRKELSLKELCKKILYILYKYINIFLVIKTLNNNQNIIKNEYKTLYNMKIDSENMISEKINNNEFKFKLIAEVDEQNKIFGNINTYIPPFLRQLWEKPKSIATILLKSERNEIKKYLASFVTHNLYDNISSLNHKDEQLIYIITLLLKEEFKSSIF